MSIGFSIKRLGGNRERWFSRRYAIVGCVVRFASLFVGIDAVLLTCNIPIQSQPNSVAAQFSRSPIQSQQLQLRNTQALTMTAIQIIDHIMTSHDMT
jgi:hypothetical protein